ncbi:MAG: DUF2892 domain-containing protein [Spirochaetia bacterium]|nr:DUF2892 domain-containing protein [Spirochaetia bacterium]
MKQNMGIVDRIIRIIISIGLVAVYYLELVTGPIGIVLLVIAGVFTMTSILGFCPVYAPVGLNTKD